MAKLLFQGHASCRITTHSGTVIYIDPFAGEGYDLPADLVLITHEHEDHNDLGKVPQRPDCTVIRSTDALAGGQYHNFDIHGVHIQTVPAGNRNHNPKECVGYILTVDGVYNMDPAEASTCARRIGGKHTIPIHTDPSYAYNHTQANRLDCPGKVLLEHGQAIEL